MGLHRITTISTSSFAALLAALLLALGLAACGGHDPQTAPAQATHAGDEDHAGEDEEHADLPAPVREYYDHAHEHEELDDELAAIEAEYHQPPEPPRAGAGEVITLTGTNIGVRLRVKLVGPLQPVSVGGRDYLAANLQLRNTGITIFEAELGQARLVDAAGKAAEPVLGVKAPCSHGFQGLMRLDVARQARGCVLFPATGDPQELQLALEQVPAEAGGRWAL
jgi:hypothetical protein